MLGENNAFKSLLWVFGNLYSSIWIKYWVSVILDVKDKYIYKGRGFCFRGLYFWGEVDIFFYFFVKRLLELRFLGLGRFIVEG